MGSYPARQKISMIKKSNNFAVLLFFSLLRSNLFLVFLTIIFCYIACINFNSKKSNILNEFRIDKIEFDGNERIPEVLLLKASGLKYKSNIFAVPINDIKRKLEQVSWIKSVSIQRKLPNKFSIRIAERVPIAILQRDYKLYLLDDDGKVLEHDGIGSFGNLPIVIGGEAEKAVKHLLFVLNSVPKIRNQLAFATFVGKRRWNVAINKGITVKFPEKNLGNAMKVLDEISDDNGFFNDDIKEIDLRLLDRVILKKEVSLERKA